MILSCDPPRHAFLIHFGPRWWRVSTRTIDASYQDARVQVALTDEFGPPTITAIHFVRHGFWLPFLKDHFSTDHLGLHWRRDDERFLLHFAPVLEPANTWTVMPGLTVIVADSSEVDFYARRRPVLLGIEIDLNTLNLQLDTSEFEFELGADTLKDVSVTLFHGVASG